MPLINATSINRAAAVLAAAGSAAAALLFGAVAHADPDPNAPVVDLKAQCESFEFGGVFVAEPTAPDGVARAVCQYTVDGYFYYDNYENGAYTETLVYRDGAKVPTERPQIPETLTVPEGLPGLIFGQ